MIMIRPGETLYRGVTLDPAILEDKDAFIAAVTAADGLTPGSFMINDRGERCVSTGDEHGLYMSPDTSMAESYALYCRRTGYARRCGYL